MANGEAPAGPASAVQQFVGGVVGAATAPIDALNLAVAKATLDLLQFLPKMPAARLFQDFVFQFGHTHPHPPTFGVPLPSMGPILASGCWSVLINGLPSARNGDMGLSVWCGGYFPIFEVMTGSSHVFIGGSRAARQLMDPTLHCLPDILGGKAAQGLGALEVAGAVFGVGMGALNLVATMEAEWAAEAKFERASVTAEENPSDLQAAADAESAAAGAAAAAIGTATAAAQLAADIAAAAMGLLMGKDPGVGFPLGMITMGSPNVLIGGFPMPGWMNIMKGLFKMLKPLIRRLQMRLPQGRLRNSLCFLTGHPVEVVTGRMFTTQEDFEIDGRIPIKFERIYDTSAVDYESHLGWGWTHPYDQHLWHSKKYNCLILRNEEGRQIRFNLLSIGEKFFQPLERIWLERISENKFEITDCRSGLIYSFGKINETDEDFQSEKRALRLLEIRNRNGNKVCLNYAENLLQTLENDSESLLNFIYQKIDGRNRLIEIRQTLKNGATITLMSYGYDNEAQLVSASNRTYIPYRYSYQDRLMIRETNRNGLSFYFEYQGEGTQAKCLRTYGDGGIHEYQLTYFPQSKITKVKDGLGGETVYHYNDLDLVTKVFTAIGGVLQFEYGEFGELLKSTDELGRSRIFLYDEQLNCVKAVAENQTVRQVAFDEFCQPLSYTDESGNKWFREYDDKGNILATVNPLQARREYQYNEKGDIVKFRNPLGDELQLSWTENGQLSEVRLPNGGKTVYQRNFRDLVEEITETASGLKTKYEYDDAGRVRKISRINQKGQVFHVRKYEYDAQGNLTIFADGFGHKTLYNYSGYNKLAEKIDAFGNVRRYKYDVKERLQEVVNEKGESHLFEYDLLGRLIAETRFDGGKTVYQYNQASELVYQKDALQRETFFRWNDFGQLVYKLHSNGANTAFEYDECGRMILAKNPHSEVKMSYDEAWNLVKEEQNGQIIEYQYDLNGRRISQQLANQEKVEFVYNRDGQLVLTNFLNNEIRYERDSAGRVVNRQLPNGLQESFKYNDNGLLSRQRVSIGENGREVVNRNYEWNILGGLTTFDDSLRGSQRYQYDALERIQRIERLVSQEIPKEKSEENLPKSWIPAEKRLWQAENQSAEIEKSREIIEFQYDETGNLLEKKSNFGNSRKFNYGRGNRLQQTEKVLFIYDTVGNLLEKRDASGITTRFSYDAENQLIAILQDNRQIEFQYDAFGRRILKKTEENSTHFLWDGDVLLAENDTQYLHRDFVPVARIKNSQIEIYHTDYLGTPKEVTDKKGEIIWQGNYSETGKVNSVIEKVSQNIRFQGQYEDQETGLFYNRFRYYDADSGRYLNQDPIGLNGGLNGYLYCQNSVNCIDPLGLWEFMNGASAVISAGEHSQTYHSSPSGHAEINGLNDFSETGRMNGQHVTISNVNGEFNGGVTKPVGVCNRCRADMFGVLQQGGATGVTIPVTRSNKLVGNITVEASQFATVRAELQRIKNSGLSDRVKSDQAWEVLERHGKFTEVC